MNLLDLLDRPIAYNRAFAAVCKSVTAGVMLSQAVYWSNRTDDPAGWFYKTAKDWFEETYLSRHELDTARRVLRDLGILEEELRGVPATLHYRLNEMALRAALEALPSRIRQTSLPESGKLDVRKEANQFASKPQTIRTETTAETTTHIAKGDDEIVPAKELFERCGKAFNNTPREVSTLTMSENGRTLIRLEITYGLLWRLEKLWAIPNGEKRKGQSVYHSTKLFKFCTEPTGDIGTARDLFLVAPPPKKAAPVKPPEPELPPLSEAEIQKNHEDYYRWKVRNGGVKGVSPALADDPKLVIPPRPVRNTAGDDEPADRSPTAGDTQTHAGDPALLARDGN